MKKNTKKTVTKHQSFVLSNSPIQDKTMNAVISVILMMILALNVWTLIYANEILQTMSY